MRFAQLIQRPGRVLGGPTLRRWRRSEPALGATQGERMGGELLVGYDRSRTDLSIG